MDGNSNMNVILLIMRSSNHEEQDSILAKIKRSSYLIVSISLLTHTFSLVYSLITFKRQSAAFISIIVSSLSCFFISSSHLTIYGISILGTLYVSMLQGVYDHYQIFYIVALSGIIMFVFWKPIHSMGAIFHCLPGKIHASMVFGIVLIVFSRFFPLAIENIEAFFILASESSLASPFDALQRLFEHFNVLTLVLTIEAIVMMFLMRGRLERIPLIGIVVLLGVLLNIGHKFKSYSDLCQMESVDCEFKVIDYSKLKQPTLASLIEVLPSAMILTVILVYEQFLYLEEFDRRGKRYNNEGNLGEITTETKTLAIANLISGCLGGLPICINIFGTYQNFAFNKKYGFKGTKWVGVLQIPFSYLLYSILDKFFTMIPLFVLFIVVATPVIYFIKNVLYFHWKNLPTILILALISVSTHPIFALVVACFISIYEISELLRPAPAEMILQNNRESSQSSKRYSVLARVVEKNKDEDTRHINEFANRIIEIDEDIPAEMEEQEYVIYRFIGSISFLNFYQHIDEIVKTIDKYCRNGTTALILSLRYSQIIDGESLNELAYLSETLRREQVRVIFTGLHERIIKQMEDVAFFSLLLQEQQKCMYSINTSR